MEPIGFYESVKTAISEITHKDEIVLDKKDPQSEKVSLEKYIFFENALDKIKPFSAQRQLKAANPPSEQERQIRLRNEINTSHIYQLSQALKQSITDHQPKLKLEEKHTISPAAIQNEIKNIKEIQTLFNQFRESLDLNSLTPEDKETLHDLDENMQQIFERSVELEKSLHIT